MPSLLNIIAYLSVAGVGVSLGLGLFFLLSTLEDKAAARDSLRQLGELEVEDQRDKDLLAPARDRLIAPAMAALGKAGNRFNPPAYVESIKAKHVQAGITEVGAVERFLAIRVLGFALIPVWLAFVFLLNPLQLSGMLQLILAAIGVAALAVVPNSRLNQSVSLRQKDIQRSLPDVLDLLVICVEAGLGFEQALDRVITNVPGELSNEFARMLGETAAGAARADALRGMQERIDTEEVRSFVLAMIQADSFGVSIGRVLRGQADEMRIKRRQLAQEKAQKAPIKMMIPMVFCVFPALFVVILGPAAIKIANDL